jgi:hypothetical protein
MGSRLALSVGVQIHGLYQRKNRFEVIPMTELPIVPAIIKELYDQGMSVRDVADKLGLSYWVVFDLMGRYEIGTRDMIEAARKRREKSAPKRNEVTNPTDWDSLPLLLTARETMAILRIASRETLKKLVERGLLHPNTIHGGQRYLFHKEEIKNLVGVYQPRKNC